MREDLSSLAGHWYYLTQTAYFFRCVEPELMFFASPGVFWFWPGAKWVVCALAGIANNRPAIVIAIIRIWCLLNRGRLGQQSGLRSLVTMAPMMAMVPVVAMAMVLAPRADIETYARPIVATPARDASTAACMAMPPTARATA